MARPFEYKILDTMVMFGGAEKSTIAVPKMYMITAQDQFVILQHYNENAESATKRKYHRLVYANKTAADTAVKKLNRMYMTDIYKVSEITTVKEVC